MCHGTGGDDGRIVACGALVLAPARAYTGAGIVGLSTACRRSVGSRRPADDCNKPPALEPPRR